MFARSASSRRSEPLRAHAGAGARWTVNFGNFGGPANPQVLMWRVRHLIAWFDQSRSADRMLFALMSA